MPLKKKERAEDYFLSDAAGLIALAGAAFLRGYSYLPGQVDIDRRPAHWLEGQLPIQVWATLWIALGVLCLVAIFVPRILPITVGIIVGINTTWLASFMGVQLTAEDSRAYVTSINYALVAFFVAWGFGRGRYALVRIDKG